MPLLARAVGAMLALVLAVGPSTVLAAPAKAKARPAPIEMTLGNPKAKVKVIEYASVVCPHCARFNADVFPAFKAKYVDTGKVLYAFRELPTEPVQVAAAGFLIARCSPGKYFQVLDALFKGQTKLFETREAKKYLLDAASVGGLNEQQVDACLADETALDAFNDRVKDALEKQKVASTPTFIIGDKVLSGEQTLEQLDAVIEPLLARK